METPSANILRMEGDSFWFHELGILLSAVAISSLAAYLHRTPISFFFLMFFCWLAWERGELWDDHEQPKHGVLLWWLGHTVSQLEPARKAAMVRLGSDGTEKKTRHFCQPWCSPGEFGKTSSYESEKPLFWPQPWYHENQLTDLDRPTDRDGSWRIFLRDPMSGTFQSCRWMELLNGSAAWIIKHLKTYEDI